MVWNFGRTFRKILDRFRYIAVSKTTTIYIKLARSAIIFILPDRNTSKMTFKKIGILLFVVAIASCIERNRMLQTNGFSDPFCAIFDQQTGDCVACICRGYFDKNRQCRVVSDLCQTWNINTG